MKRTKLVRFIGIVCWFLALFILLDGQKDKKAAEEAEKAKQQTTIVQQTEETEKIGNTTMIFPAED